MNRARFHEMESLHRCAAPGEQLLAPFFAETFYAAVAALLVNPIVALAGSSCWIDAVVASRSARR